MPVYCQFKQGKYAKVYTFEIELRLIYTAK